jgi:hypothetical protein
MEVLSALIRAADNSSLLQPLQVRVIRHRASLYADDLILFSRPGAGDLQLLRDIFDLFKVASGLGYNLAKCQMAAIRCHDQQMQQAIELFPCQVVQFAVKYLGMPLSPSKLPKSACQPLIDRAADRLPIWKGILMNRSSHLALIKTTLSAIPTYTAIALGLPGWVQGAFIGIMRAFLWTRSDVAQPGRCMVAWPIDVDGLGIINMKLFGIALRLCWLWLSRVDCSRPWSDMPVNVDSCTSAFFHISVSVEMGDSESTLFWRDRWLGGDYVADFAPDLLAAVPRCKQGLAKVATSLPNHAWIRDITRALTILVLLQYLELHRRLQDRAVRCSPRCRTASSGSGAHLAPTRRPPPTELYSSASQQP